MKTAKLKEGKIGKLSYVAASNNMFADFGLPNAELLKARTDLKVRLRSIIRERKLTQRQVAEILGVSQPYVARIMKGTLKSFSVDSLIQYLNALGAHVEIKVKMSAKATARTGETAAA